MTEDFYEEDEPLADILEAWNRGEKGVTTGSKDARQELEHELVVETIMASMGGDFDRAAESQEQLQDVQMDCLPPEGKYRIMMGKPREIPEYEIPCPDCGKVLRGGGGVAFFEDGEHGLTDELLTIETHHIFKCSARKWRWHRFKRDHLGVGWLDRKVFSYSATHKWARPARKVVHKLLF